MCMCVLHCSKFLLIKAETEVTSLSLSHLYFLNFAFCVSTAKILIAFNYAYLISTPSIYSLWTFKPDEFQ